MATALLLVLALAASYAFSLPTYNHSSVLLPRAPCRVILQLNLQPDNAILNLKLIDRKDPWGCEYSVLEPYKGFNVRAYVRSDAAETDPYVLTQWAEEAFALDSMGDILWPNISSGAKVLEVVVFKNLNLLPVKSTTAWHNLLSKGASDGKNNFDACVKALEILHGRIMKQAKAYAMRGVILSSLSLSNIWMNDDWTYVRFTGLGSTVHMVGYEIQDSPVVHREKAYESLSASLRQQLPAKDALMMDEESQEYKVVPGLCESTRLEGRIQEVGRRKKVQQP